MKGPGFPVMIILLLLVDLTVYAQQPIAYPETIYRHKAKFPRIFRSGELSSKVQLCDPQSVCVGTGLFIMENASVGQVKKCKMYLYVVKDTIRSVRIVAKRKRHANALQCQVLKEFGYPERDELKNGTAIYKWPDRWHNGVKITTRLEMSKKEGEYREWYNEEMTAVLNR